MTEQRYFFGIDLGTTNSVAACYDAAKDICTTLMHKHTPLVKSQIWKDFDNSLKVGAIPEARRSDVDYIKDVKSSMLLNSEFRMGGQKFDAITVSALILEELKHVINEQYREKVGHEITEVTITVPAAFNNIQRFNTLEAAKRAGLSVVNLINEPTSAALAYVDNMEHQETVLIYDLGGGTFDVSIVTIAPSVPALKLPKLGIDLPPVDRKMVNVLRSDGDTRLGGNDVDRLMVDIALKEHGINAVAEHTIKPLLQLAQTYKESDGTAGGNFEVEGETITFTDDIYLQATDIVFERTAKIIRSLMSTLGAISIDRIVFVGGSTKNKYLCSRVESIFKGIPVYNDINPDECVAIGAAKNSYISTGNASSIAFTDIVPGTYSILVSSEEGPVLQKMLRKGEPLPASKTLILNKTTPEQTVINIPIYQGEHISHTMNHQIGVLTVDDLPPSLSVADDIPCTLQVNRNGVLTAKTSIDGKEYITTIDTANISFGEVKEDVMLMDLEDFLTNEFQ